MDRPGIWQEARRGIWEQARPGVWEEAPQSPERPPVPLTNVRVLHHPPLGQEVYEAGERWRAARRARNWRAFAVATAAMSQLVVTVLAVRTAIALAIQIGQDVADGLAPIVPSLIGVGALALLAGLLLRFG